jgi:hypothetical protein
MKKIIYIIPLIFLFSCSKNGTYEERKNNGEICFNTYKKDILYESVCYEYNNSNKTSVNKWDINGFNHLKEKYISGVLVDRKNYLQEFPGDNNEYNVITWDVFSATSGDRELYSWTVNNCTLEFRKYWSSTGKLSIWEKRNSNCNLDGQCVYYYISGGLKRNTTFNNGNIVVDIFSGLPQDYCYDENGNSI